MALERKQDSTTNVFHWDEILDHKGPLSKLKDKERWKGCKHNVYVKWENGETTWEPVKEMVISSPAQVAKYIVEHELEDELMNEEWWRRKSVAEEVIRLKQSPFSKKNARGEQATNPFDRSKCKQRSPRKKINPFEKSKCKQTSPRKKMRFQS